MSRSMWTPRVFIHNSLRRSKSGKPTILGGACGRGSISSLVRCLSDGPCEFADVYFLLQGSIILSIAPHVFVLSNQYLDSHCSSCANVASTSPFMRCSGCGTLRYCDSVSSPASVPTRLVHPHQSCQKADWGFHKSECKALQRWAETAPSSELGTPNDAVRCLGRILWRMKSKGLDSGWVSPPYPCPSCVQSLIWIFSQKK